MAINNNQSSYNPKGSSETVCGRLQRAVNSHSPFKSLRRGSPPQNHHHPAVPVTFNHNEERNNNVTSRASEKITKNPQAKASQDQVKRVTIVEDYHKHGQEKQAHYHHHDAHFSDYISRVRNRISRSWTHMGGGGGDSGDGGGGNDQKLGAMVRRDSFNDKVSNYIHRARQSIARTGSSVVGNGNKGA